MSVDDLTLNEYDDGFRAIYRRYIYRVLFSDGTVVDVEANQDDSHLRGALLKAVGKDKDVSICGVAKLDGSSPQV